jgi:NADH dehydrogenase
MAAGNDVHHVVVIGSGFGGLFATRRLSRLPVEITVIDRTTHHLFAPLLYHVATGILSEGEIAPATRDVLRRRRNVRVVIGEVTAIDLDSRTVHAGIHGSALTIQYDSLIVAAGAHSSYFGHDEFATYAPGMKTIDDALELRGRIFGAFEMAEIESDPQLQRAWLTFVVVGGGATGVEMAGQIAELAHTTLRGNFREIDPASARIVLIDGTDRILGAFDERLSARAARKLARMGVEIHLGALVTGVDARGIDVDGATTELRRVEAMTKVWAAGVHASALGEQLAAASGAETDREGRVRVQPNCSLPGHPEVFVVGDMMALDDLPGVAEVAMQSGMHAAGEIGRRLRGDEGERPFRYRNLGSVAAISRFYAIAQLGRLRLSGLAGWLVWLFVHLAFLTGFKNRVSALFHWAISFIGRARAERVITLQQIVARYHLESASKRRAEH